MKFCLRELIMKSLVLLFCTAAATSVFGQSDADTVIAKKFNFMVYPIAFYTPETDLAGGFGGLVYFQMERNPLIRLSKIKLSAWYSINHQYSVTLSPTLYFPGTNRFQIEGDFNYAKEISKFYGMGSQSPEIENPNYSIKKTRIYAELVSKALLMKEFDSGYIFEFADYDVFDAEENPFLDSTITGFGGGKNSGLGLVWKYDYRDHLFFPANGGLYKFAMSFFGKDIGGDFTYNNFIIDIRQYVSIWNSHILAMQLYTNFTTGEPPFFLLPALGGDKRMRGYFEGRYRDRQYYTVQAEYRKMIWWRLGAVAFFAAGDVGDRIKDFNTIDMKFSYGFGLRFVFDEEEQINLRMDIGFGNNTDGVYFSLEEAF